MGSNPIAILDHRALIYVGDVLFWLRQMADDSVDCVVTSPPYWGLRDYGTAVWVDGDPKCQHEVSMAIRTPWAKYKGPDAVGKHGYHQQRPAKYIGGYCPKCGARRHDYQIGLETSLGEHLAVMVEVFEEVRRVLKPTGTLWLNYGDCYAAEPNGRSADAAKAAGHDDRRFRDKPIDTRGPIYQADWATPRGVFEAADVGNSGAGTRRVDHGGRVVAGGYLKEKDLCMIPNRLAIALQEAGWWVRSEIVWGKLNPMPDSSGRQRPSTAHEKIFLLTKSGDGDVWFARDTGEISFDPDINEMVPLITRPDKMGRRWQRMGAYYDAVAVMQESSPNSHPRMAQNIADQAGSDRAHAGAKSNGPMKAVASKIKTGTRNNPSYNAAMMSRERVAAHRRSQNVGVDPRHTEHVNHTGMSELGRGQGRLLRNFEPLPPRHDAPLPVWPMASAPFKDAHFATFPPELAERCILAGCPPGGVVLDPFGGSGTTALVALRLGRRAEMIELKPGYAEMAQRRIELDWMGEDEARRARAKAKGPAPDPGPLFSEAAE